MIIIQNKPVEKRLTSNDEAYKKRIDEICNVIFEKETLADFDGIKGLGFKQYKGTTGKIPIYGFDIGKVKSSHLSADRLLCAFVPAAELAEFEQIKNPDNEKNACFLITISKHDLQGKKAEEISHKSIDELAEKCSQKTVLEMMRDGLMASDQSDVSDEIDEINTNLLSQVIKNPKSGHHIVRALLKEDKRRIATHFASFGHESSYPVYITGVAGSGKTEIIVNAIDTINQNAAFSNHKPRVLYISHAQELVSLVRENIKKYDLTDKIDFECQSAYYYIYKLFTNDSAVNEETFNPEFKFESRKTFEEFIETIRTKELRDFLKKADINRLYLEIHGLLFGFIGECFSRKGPIISREEYSNSSLYSLFSCNPNVYKIAEEYYRYLQSTGKYKQISVCAQSLCEKPKRLPQYDYVFVDEMQDFSEPELNLCRLLANNDTTSKDYHNLMLCGDPFQLINPVFFSKERSKAFLHHISGIQIQDNKLKGNCRNPRTISNFVNSINELRFQLFGITKQDAMKPEISKNDYKGSISIFNGDPKILFDYYGNTLGSVVILTGDGETEFSNQYENIHPVTVCKGCEYDIVILYNILSGYEDIFSFERDNKELQQIFFNQFYVGITRSTNHVIIIEDNSSVFRKMIETFSRTEEQICSWSTLIDGENKFEILQSFEVIYKLGKQYYNSGEYEIAINYLKNSLERLCDKQCDFSGDVTEYKNDCIQKLESSFRKTSQDDATAYNLMAEFLCDLEQYDSAAEYYQKTQDKTKEALMYSFSGNVSKLRPLLSAKEVDLLSIISNESIKDTAYRELTKYCENRIKATTRIIEQCSAISSKLLKEQIDCLKDWNNDGR